LDVRAIADCPVGSRKSWANFVQAGKPNWGRRQ